MNDEKEEVDRPPSLKSLYETLPAEAKGVFAFLLMYILFFGGSMFIGPILQEKYCWELQTKERRFFKFNVCNGDVIEITEEYLEKAKSLSKNLN